MGRAGGGGGGGRAGGGFSGGGRAGGGFSGGGRPGGGSFGGSSRPGGGDSFGGNRNTGRGAGGPGRGQGGMGPGGAGRGPGGPGGMGPGGPGMGPGGPRPPRRGFWRFWPWYGGGYGYGPGGCSGNCFGILVAGIVIVFIVLSMVGDGIFSFASGVTRTISRWLGNDVVYEDENSDYNDDNAGNYSDNDSDYSNDDGISSSKDREKADTGVEFSADCVLDELGWFEDVEATGAALEDFYNATGVQPYIYFKAYDESVTSYDDREQYAFDWYEENIDNEGTFLFMYFAEEDSDNVVGQMFYVDGYDIEDVMDEEAVDIFWEYLNEYWYSDLSTDDMIVEVFNSTAEAIMP